MKSFYIPIIFMRLYIIISSQQKIENTTLNCNLIKNCFDCSNVHLDEINCKWINQKCQYSNEKYSDIWFDNFKECENDYIIKENINHLCKNDISKKNNIVINRLYLSENGLFSNFYCLYNIKDIKSDKSVDITLTKSQESLNSNDNYALVINFKNGNNEIFYLENKNYHFKKSNVKNIQFRYYSKDAKSENPFLLLIEYEKNCIIFIKKVFIIIIVLVTVICIIFFIIFHKWRISINRQIEKECEKSKKKEKNNNKVNNNNKIEQTKNSNNENNNIILKLNNTNSVRELKDTDNTENIESLEYNNNINVNVSYYINRNLNINNEPKSNKRSEIMIQPIKKERRYNTTINNFIKT